MDLVDYQSALDAVYNQDTTGTHKIVDVPKELAKVRRQSKVKPLLNENHSYQGRLKRKKTSKPKYFKVKHV